MNIGQKSNRNGTKIHFYYDLGRGKGQRPTTGVWIWAYPKTQEQKNFNKEALRILEVKKSRATIEEQAIGTPVIPAHKFKGNFIEYYEEYIKLNAGMVTGTFPAAYQSSKSLSRGISYLPQTSQKTGVSGSGVTCWTTLQVKRLPITTPGLIG